MKYLIFSDESGRWNEGKYYVRSWLRITPEKYLLLRKEVIFSKYETSVKELKWEKFWRNYEKFKDIFSADFDVFVTVSKPDHFKSKSYRIINEIEKVPVSTGGQALTGKIKEKIVNSAKNELFFNYFEKTHTETSKNALLPSESPEEYKYVVDTPQYLGKGWETIANECGIQQVEITKESERSPGIELADVVSGCIMELLEGKDSAAAIYQECIKSKMLDMTSRTYPNPNLIFYTDFSEEEKREMNVFR